MIKILEKTHNGIENCYIIDSDDNKKILEKPARYLWNGPIYIVARRLDDYEETHVEKDPPEDTE